MSILLAIGNWDYDEWNARIAGALPDHRVVNLPDDPDLSDIRYVLRWKGERGLFQRLSALEVIFSLGAGVDHLIGEPDLPDVPVVRVVDPDLTGRMTEWVVLQVLFHHRQGLALRNDQRERIWAPPVQPAAHAVNVGIMGLGSLGLDSARALKGLGFNVAGWSRSPKDAEGIECFHGSDGLSPFLARTDILVVLLPLTDATRSVVNLKLLSGLRQGSHMGGPALINAGQGGLQVESDILRALDDGTLAAASLDVFNEEPLPANSPFWAYPNVVVTPHNAADSDPDALAVYVADQIRRHEAGKPLLNVVDRKLGY